MELSPGEKLGLGELGQNLSPNIEVNTFQSKKRMDTLIAYSWSQTESEVLDFSCSLPSSCSGLRLSLYFADGKLKCSEKWLTHSQTVIEAQRNILEPGPSASLIRGLTPRVAYYHLELFSHRLVLRQHPTSGPSCCHYSSSTILAGKVLLPEVWKQQTRIFPFSYRKGNINRWYFPP